MKLNMEYLKFDYENSKEKWLASIINNCEKKTSTIHVNQLSWVKNDIVYFQYDATLNEFSINILITDYLNDEYEMNIIEIQSFLISNITKYFKVFDFQLWWGDLVI